MTLFLVLFGRLFYLQVVKADDYSIAAAKSRTRDQIITPRRGTIYDREGEVLAKSVSVKTIYANPKEIKKPKLVADKLAGVLGGKASDYVPMLTKPDTQFSYVAKKIDNKAADKLAKLNLTGIYSLDDTKRVYPNKAVAGQILGVVDVDNKGLSGLESYYNDLLAGKPGELEIERGRDGMPIPGGVKKEDPAKDGQDIVISIDKDIQEYTQTELAAAVKQWKAKDGTAIVMNPKTGEIYAMASTPYFDPNDLSKATPDAMRAKAVTDAYEPGSTMKTVTVASALDAGAVNANTPILVPPELKIYDQTIHDSSPHGTLHYTVNDVVTHSSNIGTAKIAGMMGGKTLYDHFLAFGLAQKPGTDFPGCTKGIFAPYDKWNGTTYANVSFGQGISVSALQLARAVCAVADGGTLVTPHFLVDEPGTDYRSTWPTSQAVSAKSAADATKILISAATTGTKNKINVPGYTVAGKTGTAQMTSAGALGYKKGAYVSSFIGYLPAEDPELLVYVVMDQPAKAYYGVTVATPAFNAIAKFTAEHLKIPTSATVVKNNNTVTP